MTAETAQGTSINNFQILSIFHGSHILLRFSFVFAFSVNYWWQILVCVQKTI